MALGPVPRTAEQQFAKKQPADWHRIQVFGQDAAVLAPYGLRLRDVEDDPTNKRYLATVDEPILRVFSFEDGDRISLLDKAVSIPYQKDDGSDTLVAASSLQYLAGLTLELVYDPDRPADGRAGWGLNNVQGRLSLKQGGTTVVEAAAVFQHEKPWFNPKFWQSRTTVPDGGPYRLLPRASQANGIDQLQEANHAWSWWLIDYQWQRSFNVHCGSMSEGCATMSDRTYWETFYQKLVLGRFDGQRTHAAELTVRAESGPRKTTVIFNQTTDNLAVYRADGGGTGFEALRLPAGHTTPEAFAAVGFLVPSGRGLATGLLGRYDGPVPFDTRGLEQCTVTPDGSDYRPSITGRPGRPTADWPVIDPGSIGALPPVPGSVPGATPPPADDPFTVDRGQITFDAEGMEGGFFHSRKPHVPDDNSGLTIGRGYDMKTKSAARIKADLKAAGLSDAEATRYSGAAGKKGDTARKFRDENALVEITPEQQKSLFLSSYDDAAADVKRICEKPDVVAKYGATDFANLNPLIRDILVDLRFRGDYSGATRAHVQHCVVANDVVCLRGVISNRNLWLTVPKDRFRRRVEYLNRTMPAPPSPNT
jgi:hypothetical protein